MRIDVFTLFPSLITDFTDDALLGKAQTRGLVEIRAHDLREHTNDVHRTVDDSPFGGGAGMVLMPEPLIASIDAADPPRPLFFLGPAGRRFDQVLATELAATDGFSLLCGRYEGVDQRVLDSRCDGELSIGDYVLAGGEAAALVVIEAVGRLVPGVMGNATSSESESFAGGLLEYPQYTRPAVHDGVAVPDVLRSGDHARVARWRHAQALVRTAERRPDLLAGRGSDGLSDGDGAILDEFDLRSRFDAALDSGPTGGRP